METETPVDRTAPVLPVDRDRGQGSSAGARVWAAVRARLSQEVVLFLFVLVLAVAFGFNQSVFWSGVNLQNLSRQGAVLAMVAAGSIFPILIGGIDLSVGGQVSMLSIFAVQLSHNMPVYLAFLLTIGAGAGIGLVNGLLVTYGRISPIIATLGTWQVMVGFTLWYTKGLPVRNFSDSYRALGANNVWFLPAATVLAVGVVAVAWVLLKRTRFGRYVYALGGNFEAARLSGVRTTFVTIAAYVTCAVFTAVGAITLSSRVGSGLPGLGGGIEIQAIAAVFIGGVAWGGGAGSVVGAVIGVALVTVLGNGLDLAAVSSDLQTMITGALVVLAVGLNARRKKLSGV
jgi:ribose/xylose/arabinose/galactoside ABC-type transport system permease subunit